MPDEPSRRLYPALYPNFDRQFDREAKAEALPPAPDLDADDRPLWRRVADYAGVGDEIDAAGDAWRSSSDWLRSKVGLDTPEAQAASAALNRRLAGARPRDTGPGLVSRVVNSAPVQQMYEDTANRLWRPTPEVKFMGDMARQGLADRAASQQEALDTLPAPLRWAHQAQNNWLPNALVSQGESWSTPVGAAADFADPLLPAAKVAGPLLAKAVGAAPDLAQAALARIPPRLNAPYEMVDDRLLISTRVPTAKNLAPFADEPSAALFTGLDEASRDPALMRKFALGIGSDPLMARYGPFRRGGRDSKPADVVRAFRDQAEGSIGHLIDMVPGEIGQRAGNWYPGAHRLGNELAERIGVTGQQGAGLLATQSPSKDWNQNIDIANRLGRWWREFRDTDAEFSEQLFDRYADTAVKSGLAWIKQKKLTGPKAARVLAGVQRDIAESRAYVGHRFSDLPDIQRAQMIRAHSEMVEAPHYQLHTPEGYPFATATTTKGDPALLQWQTYPIMARGLSLLEDASPANFSFQLGKGHKVRSFFNNINVPFDVRSTTVDTHNVAGGHMRPLGGSAPEVAAVMGGVPASARLGIRGGHPMYRDAVTEAAVGRGLRPNQGQSISWEGIKGLFTPAQKSDKKFKAQLNQIFDDYRRGTLTQEQVYDRVEDLAGGFKPPEWAKYDAEGRPLSPGGTPPDQGGTPGASLGPVRPGVPAGRGYAGGPGGLSGADAPVGGALHAPAAGGGQAAPGLIGFATPPPAPPVMLGDEALPPHVVQESRELLPGPSTRHMPELLGPGMEEERGRLHRIAIDQGGLYDAQGHDRIAQAFGATTLPSFEGPGLYKGTLTPGVQTRSLAGVEPVPGGAPGALQIDAASRARLDAIGASYAIPTGQDAYAWSSLLPAGSGVPPGTWDVTLPGGRITPRQVDTLRRYFGRGVDEMALIPTPEGVRLGASMDDAQREAAMKILGGVRKDEGVDLYSGLASSYVTNDWGQLGGVGSNYLDPIRNLPGGPAAFDSVVPLLAENMRKADALMRAETRGRLTFSRILDEVRAATAAEGFQGLVKLGTKYGIPAVLLANALQLAQGQGSEAQEEAAFLPEG